MKEVLIISDAFRRGDRPQQSFRFGETIQVTEVALRQASARRLSRNPKALRRVDLIIVHNSPMPSQQSAIRHLLIYLEATGIPIMMLPSDPRNTSAEPRVWNWPGDDAWAPDLQAIIEYACSRSSGKALKAPADSVEGEHISTVQTTVRDTRAVPPLPRPKDMPNLSEQPDRGKASHTLASIQRIAGQLREPLSNMNLAIHMLSRVQSATDQARYLKLLREEYQRELQLLNQLDSHLQSDAVTAAPPKRP